MRGQRISLGEGREFLTVEEAAKVLGIGRVAAYRMVSDGSLAHRRMGRTIRIPISAVQYSAIPCVTCRRPRYGATDPVDGEWWAVIAPCGGERPFCSAGCLAQWVTEQAAPSGPS